jgi:predicted nucleotidyltransferase
MARDLVLHYGHGVPIARATADVDLAFEVADWRGFDALRNALLASGKFTQDSAPHRLRHRRHTPLDLIPFGGVEAPDRTITCPSTGNVMQMVGYREARATALEVLLPASEHVQIVSLSMLATLKLLTWSERHLRQPRKDASDLLLILKHYLSPENTERLYDDAAHLLETDDFNYEIAGAWLAGNDAASQISACSANPAILLDACETILARQTDPDGPLKLVAESETEITLGRRLLQGFLDGVRAHRA